MCATMEVLELVRTMAAGVAPPACPWCGAPGPAWHFDRAGLAAMFHCRACRAGFTWVLPGAARACGAP